MTTRLEEPSDLARLSPADEVSRNSRSLITYDALPAADLSRIRVVGSDDFGHPVRVLSADTEPGFPLRCCLREARVGERVALIAWRPLTEAPDSVFAEIGPVFFHPQDCGGYEETESYPEGFRHREQVLRSYTATGDMHETSLVTGSTAEAEIQRLLSDPAAAVVHSRNVEAGCYMFAIRRHS